MFGNHDQSEGEFHDEVAIARYVEAVCRHAVEAQLPGNVVPVDRFFQDVYYPGLLAAIWRGERPLPEVQIGESLPPRGCSTIRGRP